MVIAQLLDTLVGPPLVAASETLERLPADVGRGRQLRLGHLFNGRNDHCAPNAQARDADLQGSPGRTGLDLTLQHGFPLPVSMAFGGGACSLTAGNYRARA